MQNISSTMQNISSREQKLHEYILEQLEKLGQLEKKELLEQLEQGQLEQFEDAITFEPISSELKMHKKTGHLIDQKAHTAYDRWINPDDYYTKNQVLEKLKNLENVSEEQLRKLLPVLKKCKDFELTKLFRKNRQLLNENQNKVSNKQEKKLSIFKKIKLPKLFRKNRQLQNENQNQVSKVKTEIQQIVNSLSTMKKKQKQIEQRRKKLLLNDKKSLQDKLQMKKKQLEEEKGKVFAFFFNGKKKEQITAQIQQLQKEISNIERLLDNGQS